MLVGPCMYKCCLDSRWVSGGLMYKQATEVDLENIRCEYIFLYIYYVIVLKVHTQKKIKCIKRKEKKKQLTTNMCIDHQLIP